MVINELNEEIQKEINHKFISITSRGNSAIKAALSLVKGKLLIPEEGGWLSYRQLPEKRGLKFDEVKCHDAKIDLDDLEKKLCEEGYSAFLYQNPGGYHAEQPMRKISELCQKYDCLVILDVSGGIGTKLCDGNYADVIVCSFGKWKLVDAGKGGFISCKNKELFDELKVEDFVDGEIFMKIEEKFKELQKRISSLTNQRKKIINDLDGSKIINKSDLGFVVVVEFADLDEREKIIDYCKKMKLEWTECPRYIRVNKKAISIEVKRL